MPSEQGLEAHDDPVELANFAKLHADIEAWHAEASVHVHSECLDQMQAAF